MTLTEDTWRPPNAWCDHTHHWHAADDQATEEEVIELVAAFVRALQPEIAVETGTWLGHATQAIGEALRRNGHGHLHAVEYDSALAQLARSRCEGLPVTVHHDSSLSWSPPGGIGFAWVDGATDRGAEAEHLLPCMLPGAIIAMHDTGPLHCAGRMDWLNAHPRLRAITLRTPRGVSFAEVQP
jgi:Methyltransferase domain